MYMCVCIYMYVYMYCYIFNYYYIPTICWCTSAINTLLLYDIYTYYVLLQRGSTTYKLSFSVDPLHTITDFHIT